MIIALYVVYDQLLGNRILCRKDGWQLFTCHIWRKNCLSGHLGGYLKLHKNAIFQECVLSLAPLQNVRTANFPSGFRLISGDGRTHGSAEIVAACMGFEYTARRCSPFRAGLNRFGLYSPGWRLGGSVSLRLGNTTSTRFVTKTAFRCTLVEEENFESASISKRHG